MKADLVTASLAVLYLSYATVIRSPLQEHNLLVSSIFSGAMRISEGIQTVGGSMTFNCTASILLDIVR